MLQINQSRTAPQYGNQSASADAATLFIDVIPLAMRKLRSKLAPVTDEKWPLSLPQLRLLAILKDAPCTIKSLADMAGVSVPAVSRMVRFLEKKSYVIIKTHKLDGRCVTVSLSDKGSLAFQQAHKIAENRLMQCLRELPESQLHDLCEQLGGLKTTLSQL